MDFDIPADIAAYLHELDTFIESTRIQPGSLGHLYPEPVKDDPQLSSYWGKGTSVAPARWVMN